jgi:hypothetical protein
MGIKPEPFTYQAGATSPDLLHLKNNLFSLINKSHYFLKENKDLNQSARHSFLNDILLAVC